MAKSSKLTVFGHFQPSGWHFKHPLDIVMHPYKKLFLFMINFLQRWDAKMTTEERAAIEVFLSLPPEKRKIIGEIIYAFAK